MQSPFAEMTDPQLATFAKLFVEQIEHLKERDTEHEDIPVHQRLLAMAQAEITARAVSGHRRVCRLLDSPHVDAERDPAVRPQL